MGATKKILVADDSPAIQKIASSILAGDNVQIITVANGIAAIKKYELEKPHVVLADIEMPGKDGYEVCDYIKKTPEHDQTMVLLVVGAMEHCDEDRAKEVKADGVVKKPFNVRELFDMVHGHLEKISQAEAAAIAPPPVMEASSAAPLKLPDSDSDEAADPDPDLEPPKPAELDFSNLKEPIALGEIPMDFPEESPAPEPASAAAPEEKKAPVFDLAAALGDLDIPALASQAVVRTEAAANPPTAKAPVPAQKESKPASKPDSKPDSKPAAPAQDSASAAILGTLTAKPKAVAPVPAQKESKPDTKPDSKPAAPTKDAASAAILGAMAAKPKAPVPVQKESKPDLKPDSKPVSTPAGPAGKAQTPPAAPAVDASMIQAVVEKAIASSSTEKGAFDAKAVHTTVEKALEALLAPKMAKEVAERITSELSKQLKGKK